MPAVKQPCDGGPRERITQLHKLVPTGTVSPSSDVDDSNESNSGAALPLSRSSVVTSSTTAPGASSPKSSLQSSFAAADCDEDDVDDEDVNDDDGNLLGLGSDEDDDVFGDAEPVASPAQPTDDEVAPACDDAPRYSQDSIELSESETVLGASCSPPSTAPPEPGASSRKSPFYSSSLVQAVDNEQRELARCVPSLTQLCLSRIRKLRCRIEGLALLPTEVVAAIVEGSTAEELKQMELVNKHVTSTAIWDTFWEAVCQKSMAPAQLAKKPMDESWRDFYVRYEKEKKAKLIEAGQRCRDRWNNLQTSRDRTVALDDSVASNGFESIGLASRRRVTGGRGSASSTRSTGGASAGAVKAIRKSLSAGFSPSPKFSSAQWQNRVPPSRTQCVATPSGSNNRLRGAGTVAISGTRGSNGSGTAKVPNSLISSTAAGPTTGPRAASAPKSAGGGAPRTGAVVNRSSRHPAVPPLGSPAAKVPRLHQPGSLARIPGASSDLGSSKSRGARTLVPKVAMRNDYGSG